MLKFYYWSAGIYLCLSTFYHRRLIDREFFAEVFIACIPLANTLMCVVMLGLIYDEERNLQEVRKQLQREKAITADNRQGATVVYRKMTHGELHSWYTLGQWPCGHGNKYIEGPCGGASMNVFCPVCGLGLNVIDPSIPMVGGGLGEVIREPEGYVPPPDPPPPSLWQKFKRWWAEI